MAWTFHSNTADVRGVLPSDGRVHPQTPHKEYPGAALSALPAPRLPPIPLERALRARASCRRFSGSPLGLVELSTVLHAAYGVWARGRLAGLEFLERAAPSAGGLYPLEFYVLAVAVESQATGVYHYSPLLHGLEQVTATPLPPRLVTALFMGQPWAGQAAAVVVLTAVVGRGLDKYGERGYRYLLLEAGHATQNLNLAAAALGLGACNLGAFADEDLADLLGLDLEVEIPLYGVAVGSPAKDG